MPLDIGKWIKGWRLEKLFHPEHAEEVKTDIHSISEKAVDIAEKIKGWINNPIVDFIDNFLPKTVRDAEGEVKKDLNIAIPIILAGLTGLTDPLKMEENLKPIKFTSNFYWDKFFHDLAVGIANVLSDGTISFADLAIAVQFVKDDVLNKEKQ